MSYWLAGLIIRWHIRHCRQCRRAAMAITEWEQVLPL